MMPLFDNEQVVALRAELAATQALRDGLANDVALLSQDAETYKAELAATKGREERLREALTAHFDGRFDHLGVFEAESLLQKMARAALAEKPEGGGR